MIKRLFLSPLLVAILLIHTGCAWERYVRSGRSYEKSQMHALAVEQYVLSLSKKNHGNVAARIGLMRAARRYADTLEESIAESYKAQNDADVVDTFLTLKELQKNALVWDVSVDIAQNTRSMYDESKIRYLRSSYAVAVRLMNDEKFIEAQPLFQKILTIDPLYERAGEFYQIVLCEPIYRLGKQQLQSHLYRSAFATFSQLIRMNAQYKDVMLLQQEALHQAVLTIAFQPFRNGVSWSFLADEIIAATNIAINGANNPFLKMVSLDFLEEMLMEQRQAIIHQVPFNANLIMPVRVFLHCTILRSEYSVSPLRKTTQKAFLRYMDEQKQPQFRKVEYEVYEQSARADFRMQYEFVRVSDGLLLAFDRVEQHYTDEIKFAESEYEVQHLIPADWGAGRRDTMFTSDTHVKAMRQLFNARKLLLEKRDFEEKYAQEVATRMVRKIAAYDPEK